MTARCLAQIGIGMLFVGAGVIHFTNAGLFEGLVPVALKGDRASINAVTGLLTIAMGIAFFVPRFRSAARWSTITLLLVTLPTTIYRAFHPEAVAAQGLPSSIALIAVAAWLGMIALIWWATKPDLRSGL